MNVAGGQIHVRIDLKDIGDGQGVVLVDDHAGRSGREDLGTPFAANGCDAGSGLERFGSAVLGGQFVAQDVEPGVPAVGGVRVAHVRRR